VKGEGSSIQNRVASDRALEEALWRFDHLFLWLVWFIWFYLDLMTPYLCVRVTPTSLDYSGTACITAALRVSFILTVKKSLFPLQGW
jgi:hypothetical protein